MLAAQDRLTWLADATTADRPTGALGAVVSGVVDAAAIVNASVALPVPLLFVAEMVELTGPDVVGVPVIRPVVEETVRPAGRFFAL